MKTILFLGCVGASLAGILAACSVSVSATGGPGTDGGNASPESGLGDIDGGTADSGPGVVLDPGTYPALKPDIGTLVDNGGAKLVNARIVSVNWSVDPNVTAYQTFGDMIGGSKYWSTTTSEYGISTAASGAANHVLINTAPTSPWDDSDLETWVISQINNTATSGWPVADANTVYVIYVPSSVNLTTSGQNACDSYEGYHAEIAAGGLEHVEYAVVAEGCNGDGTSEVDGATQTASHEIAESATDPHTYSDLAIAGFDDQHFAWEVYQQRQDENGDACENYFDAYYTEGADLPYSLQRLWSNKSALAGHNPCVPLPAEPYFNLSPVAQEQITGLQYNNAVNHNARGYSIPVGTSKTFQVGFYSDAQHAPWKVVAVEGNGYNKVATPHLTITMDKNLGSNGDVANVTVTTTAAPNKGTSVLMTIESTSGELEHDLPILINTK